MPNKMEITKKEAISILTQFQEYRLDKSKRRPYDYEVTKALTMAIEALQPQPPTVTDEEIDNMKPELLYGMTAYDYWRKGVNDLRDKLAPNK